jgi:hypothetical protein
MSAKLVNVDRNTPMLLAPDLREWLPADHIVHFIIESVEGLDLRDFGSTNAGAAARSTRRQ